MVPKYQNLIISEGGQYTLSLLLKFQAIPPMRCQENVPKPQIWFGQFHCYQHEENQHTITMYAVLKVVRVHQLTKLQAIPPMLSQENAQKPLGMNARKVSWSVGHLGNCQPNSLVVSQSDGPMDRRTDGKHNAYGA